MPHTAFRVGVRARAALDLDARTARARACRVDLARAITHATQALATAARAPRIECIRYESVRDPAHGACVAVLVPGVSGATDRARSRPGSSPPRASACAREAERGEGAGCEFAARQLRRRRLASRRAGRPAPG